MASQQTQDVRTRNGPQDSGSRGETGMTRAQGATRAMERSRDPHPMLAASPFTLMRRMMEDMFRLFEDVGGMPRSLHEGQGREPGMSFMSAPAWAPPMEVRRDGNRLHVRAELPGVDREDVDIELMDDALVIEGHRSAEREEQRGDVIRSERVYGRFRRVVPLPDGVDPDRVEARLEHGLLEVSLELPEERSRRRRISLGGGERPKGEPPAQEAARSRDRS